jgi:Holliday junction resolvase RusA-like endonuclease
MKINIKPISVNKCWQGKRFKTSEYKNYEKELLYKLPRISLPNKPLEISIEFGFSNKASDIDNPMKPFLDILQKKYGFDDKDIYSLNTIKKIVKRKEEYIVFSIQTFIEKEI